MNGTKANMPLAGPIAAGKPVATAASGKAISFPVRLPGNRLARLLVWAMVLTLMIGSAGFVWFSWTAMSYSGGTSGVQRADGIVALTGGPSRIEEGLALLDAGQAKRLLISGVHPATSRKRILARRDAASGSPAKANNSVSCCIDIDRKALDTRGNASQTAIWAASNNFKRLIIVTSSYHMQRALLEFGNKMPDAVLLPHAVSPISLASANADPVDAGTDQARNPRREIAIRLLLREYAKFVAASARILAEKAFAAL